MNKTSDTLTLLAWALALISATLIFIGSYFVITHLFYDRPLAFMFSLMFSLWMLLVSHKEIQDHLMRWDINV